MVLVPTRLASANIIVNPNDCECRHFVPGCGYREITFVDCVSLCRAKCPAETEEQRRQREARAAQEREQARLRQEQHKQQLLNNFKPQTQAQPTPIDPATAQLKNQCLAGNQAACQQLKQPPPPPPKPPEPPAPKPPDPPKAQTSEDCYAPLLACQAEAKPCHQQCTTSAESCRNHCIEEQKVCKEPKLLSLVCLKQFKACYAGCESAQVSCGKTCRSCAGLSRHCSSVRAIK